MKTVRDFFEKVALNEYHNIRIKSSETDTVVCNFNNYRDMEKNQVENKEIKDFATDWENKIYILWV